LLFALGLGDHGRSFAFCNIDFFLLLAFRSGDDRAFFSLCRNLQLHRAQNLFRRRQILNFITQNLHAPGLGGFVHGLDDSSVDLFTFFERFVERHRTDNASERCLRKLCNGHHKVGRSVAGKFRIGDLKVEDAVHLQLSVVFGNADLARCVHRNFFERLAIGNAIDNRNDEIQARLKHGVKFSESFDDPGFLLRNDANRFCNEDDGKNCQHHDEYGEPSDCFHIISPV